jgi:hypothetical protein
MLVFSCITQPAIAATSLTSLCQGSDVVTNPDNAHQYCLTAPSTWTAAQASAQAQGGNLVTINDQAEQDWLLQTFGNTAPLWIGYTDQASEGTFVWVSGQSATYTNWLPTEPNDGKCYANEDYAAMNWFSEIGSWNDLPDNGFWQDCTGVSAFCGLEGTLQEVPEICNTGFVTLAGLVEIEPPVVEPPVVEPPVVEPPVVPEPTGGTIQGTKWNDMDGDGVLSGAPALAGVEIYLDLNQNGALDAGEPTQITGDNGEYRFTGLEAGTYVVREVVPEGFEQTYPAKRSTPGDGLADTVIEFYDSGTGPIPGPYGSSGGIHKTRVGRRTYTIEPVNPNVVLGPIPPSPVVGRNAQVDWVSLPSGSYLTVGFTDEVIVDGPGDDVFIRSFDRQDSANENADIYVSSNGTDFTFLGRVNERGLVKLDLASIGYTAPVTAVRVVGVDEKGTAPGFDLITVLGLPGSVSAPDYHTVDLAKDATVDQVDFGNHKS